MMVCREKRITDEVALTVGYIELHGKILYFLKVRFCGKVSMALDKGIGPFLSFVAVYVVAKCLNPFPLLDKGSFKMMCSYSLA